MKWIEIQELQQLKICPWCSNTIISSIVITKTNRSYLKCSECDCEMFEINTKLWYKVPDITIIKQKELTGYYGSKV